RAADDFGGLEPGSFDAVVLNSVAQYFPSADYLLRVLEGAARVLAPGGALFVGDVRSLPLLEAFHASVELAQAPPELPTALLRQRVRRRLEQEEELVVDPALFAAFAARSPRLASARVLPKRGLAANELAKFRYDALLHAAGPAPPAPPPGPLAWLDWQAGGWTLDALRRHLASDAPEVVALAGIPNARVH